MNSYPHMNYLQIYKYICSQISDEKLVPIKASKLNGKKPALYNAYWQLKDEKKEKDYSKFLDELKYKINPKLNTMYYQKNPEKYLVDRKNICILSDYLTERQSRLTISETINERSFEIFHREKYLDREGGRELLSRLGISGEDLNFYQTWEPMSYYSHQKKTPQNFLIIENKDTFYSMRKHLISGNDSLLHLSVGTLIYGGGKGIYKTFEDYIHGVEPYFADKNNQVFYFGDIDYEGILIYETLAKKYEKYTNIILFTEAYEKMIYHAEQMGMEELPDTKEGQNKNIGELFLKQFTPAQQKKIKHVLHSGKYIPQEILNEGDYETKQMR